MAGIQVERVTKVYDGRVTAVDDVSLAVADGEFMVLVGPSGCGKSTLLRVIAGLEQVTRGRVLIGDDDVTALDPADRDVAMVFQSYALYPHKTVRENLAFGLRRRHVASDEVRRRVDAMAEMLGLGELLERKPAALSGGQRQRVAMGRALVREPRTFLMDEPLSNLDAKLRTSMRGELARLHERMPTTTVYVTHDQVEAMTLGQRVAVLKDGRVQQCDVPQRLFDEPANLFVGAFIGSPAMNLVEATVTDGLVRFGEQEILLEGAAAGLEGEVVLGIRPTSLSLAEPHMDARWPRMTARIDIVEALGAERNVLFTVDAPPVTTEDVRAAIGGAGGADEGRLLADDRRARFTARIHGQHPIVAGDTIELAIDPSQVHLFERESGGALEWRSGTVSAAALRESAS
jgi:multiple sugar transport system ATP-binding protein